MAARRRNDKKRAWVTDLQWRFLKGDPLPKTFDSFVLEIDFHGTNEELWNLHREVILNEHVKQNPGTRPALWWKFDAPRLPVGTFPGCYYDGQLPEPRKRLRGTGTPAHEVMNVVPVYDYGLPMMTDIDEDDPPIFESQAAYLKRHGLLMAGEK